ncbi:hypothetical protein KQ306_10555 [Synechococcus sp. CS-1324]|uniref:hypothetical protein n=1 Tax=Synechococcus sp. CS-1324 TaxID=2847980 RepID=UPI00223A7B6F|nr:hypothetical protein [Synechococcus sp. CS-1324]MCT0231288.1 hypothetical protein [Synechococcus sp. CS-1324]
MPSLSTDVCPACGTSLGTRDRSGSSGEGEFSGASRRRWASGFTILGGPLNSSTDPAEQFPGQEISPDADARDATVDVQARQIP